MSGNSWLARQRKSELIELAQAVGVKDHEGMRKSDLELAIDEVLTEHTAHYQSDPRFQDYFKSRARASGSPLKRELAAVPVSRRRTIKAVEEAIPSESEPSPSPSPSPSSPTITNNPLTTAVANTASSAAHSAAQTASTTLAATPGRAMALAQRLQLPASPADVAQAVDRGTVAVREHITTLYHDSGLTDAAHTARDALSTVHSVAVAVALFEMYKLRQEVLPDRYAFTVPAGKIPVLGGWAGWGDWPVQLPDMFCLLTGGFWGPVLTWLVTSIVLPGVVGYFVNLSVAHQQRGRGRKAVAGQQEYSVDPLMFSVVKAVVTYVVYAQGVTFGGVISPETVARINGALYSGWQGVLVGTAVSGLVAVYDAVLRK